MHFFFLFFYPQIRALGLIPALKTGLLPCQPCLPVMFPRRCRWERVEGEKRKHGRQISGILQRIRSWELELALCKWWNVSPKGPWLRSTQMVTKRSSPAERRGGMINTLSSSQLLHFSVPFPSLHCSKRSCSGGLFRFEHELALVVGIWKWQTCTERQGPEKQRGHSQTLELFMFAETQKWSCYPGGALCFPYTPVTWQAFAGALSHWTLLPSLAASHSSLPLWAPLPYPFLPLSSHHRPLTPAGKRSWPAMETAWLRRRPGRCTGDKFVCVSWAATLRGRTLTRSCQ